MTSAQSQSLIAERNSAYLEYTRQETMTWHESLHAYHQQRDRTLQHFLEEMAAGRVPQLQPAPSPPPQPVLLTFEGVSDTEPWPLAGNWWIYRWWWCWSWHHSRVTEPGHSYRRRRRRSWR
ncbi:uncharacterized protein LOC119342033 [Triticum dicoccoides]|uniref:uncharacterized protein LOC119342033 n=1 Tax=Triticum dicoccoides TaxID=85692 RepID=UPI001891CB03|nr:uncharacterized protein LOC119342033 [Triticum dicoccoides]